MPVDETSPREARKLPDEGAVVPVARTAVECSGGRPQRAVNLSLGCFGPDARHARPNPAFPRVVGVTAGLDLEGA